jgi:hypothetical protein
MTHIGFFSQRYSKGTLLLYPFSFDEKILILNAITGRFALKAVTAYGCEKLDNPPRGHHHCSSSVVVYLIQIRHC